MILVDTTILVYAIGTEDPLRSPCRELLALIRDGLVRASASVEVVQEFTHVRARRTTRPEAAARAREYALGLSPLVRPDDADLREGLAIFEALADLGAFGAVLAATARRRGWAVASADRSFDRVDRLTCLDPTSPGFLESARGAG
ncbi:MAG TPA: PIN domain-containing protein [Verrucomicrobiae bacterium]|nr:PIN domain-containing protein [Verrucomicrobiae bacterium]